MPSLKDFIDEARENIMHGVRSTDASKLVASAVSDGLNALCDFILERAREAERTGYIGDLYRTDYVVEGRGPFPVDMLRYACSWPKTEADVGRIERSHEEPPQEWAVHLTRNHRDPAPTLADERWERKYHWRIISRETTKL